VEEPDQSPEIGARREAADRDSLDLDVERVVQSLLLEKAGQFPGRLPVLLESGEQQREFAQDVVA
jgi:hypothetical protein